MIETVQHDLPTDDPDVWLEQVALHYPQIEKSTLETAIKYTQTLSKSAASPYTSSTLEQGLRMAKLLLELNCDSDTIAASIAYPSIYYAQPNRDKVNQALTVNVSKLIYGATRMEAIHDMHNRADTLNQQQVDNLRKMLLAIIDDIRIVFIKLAERLITLQYLKHCSSEQQHYLANQVMSFYAPLANRLGIGQLKWQLEDFAFRFLHPDEYFSISKALSMRRSERETFINETMTELNNLLNEHDIIDFSLSGRAKHIYSIYKKSQRKNLPVSEIYDASALRILVNSVPDCYSALSLVHQHWRHIEKEFDDYIANPKPNGYQSIHTAITKNGNHVEIQIRTFHMHESAELGVAAHWKYKEGGSDTQENYEAKIERLRELISWQQEVTEGEDADLYSSIFSDRIYAFTPKGDVVDLPTGSTPLDFAYHIHTSVGNRTKGAKVNDKMVTLSHVLKTGDRVEIITSKHEQPSRDWINPQLGYLNTAHAIAKVRAWFKKQNFQSDLDLGNEMWEKATRHENLNKSDLAHVTKRFNVNKVDDLLAVIGSKHIGIHTVIAAIKAQKDTQTHIEPTHKLVKPRQPKSSSFEINGVGNLLTHLAKCCKPIPGDEIIGYITKGRGISIHHTDCDNIKQDLLTKPERIIEVSWGNASNSTYPIDLTLIAEDRSGLVRDITSTIANEKLAILGLNSHVNRSTNEGIVHLTIEVNSNATFNHIRNQLLQIPGIINIMRG